MSRGFDWFELDDSRSSGFDSGREIGSGSSSNWSEWLIHQNIRREEERTDNLDRQGRDRSGQERPLRPREERLETILAERVRTRYFDREKEYSLRDSEIHLLSEVGKFRVDPFMLKARGHYALHPIKYGYSGPDRTWSEAELAEALLED